MANRGSLALAILILVQVSCAVFFLWDVMADASSPGELFTDPHLLVELLATVVLLIGIAVEWQYLALLLRRQARTERALNVAAGELHDLMEQYFRDWGLTPSEADVAMFALKGSSISEIAELRGSKDGTIKAHLNGIYRKAGVSGRAQLVSLLVEDLMAAPLGGASQTG
ncbi:MAG TPA: LuxR family transcriptional regulator [Aliiroseovarius sp.]|nr:LuxR family transcriptional regulator [Aliiroseovarius sp.]